MYCLPSETGKVLRWLTEPAPHTTVPAGSVSVSPLLTNGLPRLTRKSVRTRITSPVRNERHGVPAAFSTRTARISTSLERKSLLGGRGIAPALKSSSEGPPLGARTGTDG